MTEKIEEIIKEIAVKHGIAVGRDDPILILQTINDRLIHDMAAAQEKILGLFREEIESISHRWGADAKEKAERTLNAALAASRNAMNQAIEKGATVTAEVMRRMVDESVGLMAAPIRESKRVALMNIIASCITVVAAGLALWAVL